MPMKRRLPGCPSAPISSQQVPPSEHPQTKQQFGDAGRNISTHPNQVWIMNKRWSVSVRAVKPTCSLGWMCAIVSSWNTQAASTAAVLALSLQLGGTYDKGLWCSFEKRGRCVWCQARWQLLEKRHLLKDLGCLREDKHSRATIADINETCLHPSPLAPYPAPSVPFADHTLLHSAPKHTSTAAAAATSSLNSPHAHDVAAALLVPSVVPPLDSHPAAKGLGVRLLLPAVIGPGEATQTSPQRGPKARTPMVFIRTPFKRGFYPIIILR